MCDLVERCECWTAVTRVFRELKERCVSDKSAFDAAAKVYRYYHPDVSPLDARFTVAEWIDESDIPADVEIRK